ACAQKALHPGATASGCADLLEPVGRGWRRRRAAASPRSPGASLQPPVAQTQAGKRVSHPHGRPGAAAMGRQGAPCPLQALERSAVRPGCHGGPALGGTTDAPPLGVHAPSSSECPETARHVSLSVSARPAPSLTLLVPDHRSPCVFFPTSVPHCLAPPLGVVLPPALGAFTGGSNLQVGRSPSEMPLRLLDKNKSHP
ncbi:unnamed protein product, partial [Gulo gulo]